MLQLHVTLLAFDERLPAVLVIVKGVPSLVVERRVYMPGELPRNTKILVPPADDFPAPEREAFIRLVAAARTEGFDIVDEVPEKGALHRG